MRRLVRPAVLVALLLLAVAAPVGAAAPGESAQRLERSVRYLQEVQNPDGGFGGERGSASDPLFTSWVAYALASFDVNPQDQARPGGTDVHTYLTRHTDALVQTTDFERTVLVAVASGTNPRRFGEVDLVQPILDRQLGDGSLPQRAGGTTGYVNATIFGVLALAPLEFPDKAGVLEGLTDWIVAEQLPEGGWHGFDPSATDASLDMTGAALEALAAGGRRSDPAVEGALDLLRRTQLGDGGWPASIGERESNAASTAWVMQGLLAIGRDPAAWMRDGRTPYDYLASMQQTDGSIRWKAATDLNRVWMTAQVAPALAGRFYPLAATPRSANPPAQPDGGGAPVTPASGAGAGQGGTGPTAGDGVIAGGGGSGAPLFSRPKAQSQGRTSGGARQIDRSRTRDGRRRATGAQPDAAATPAPTPAAAAPAGSGAVAAPAPAAPAPVAAAATPVGGGSGGEDPGSGMGAPGAAPTAIGGGTAVTGRLIADGSAGDGEQASAPGLLGSKVGDPGSSVPTLVLAGLLVLAAIAGWRAEIGILRPTSGRSRSRGSGAAA